MGEEGERDGAGGAAADLGMDTMERLHLEGSEDMTSGGSCENTSKEQVSIGECPERSPEVAKSSARNVDLKPESIQSGSSINKEEKVAKKEEKKVPRHRRFWESSDCSCSKEVPYFTAENIGGKILNCYPLRFLRRVIGKKVKSHGKEVQGNSK